METALAALNREVSAQVQSRLTPPTSLTPTGVAAFPLPGIDTSELVTAGINFALAQLARQFGGVAEDYVEAHRTEILATVPDEVLNLAQSLIDKLSAGR